MIDGVLNGYYHTQVIVITMHRVAQEDDKRGTQQIFFNHSLRVLILVIFSANATTTYD